MAQVFAIRTDSILALHDIDYLHDSIEVEAFIGIVMIQQRPFLIVVTDADEVGKIDGHPVFMIRDVEFVSVSDEHAGSGGEDQTGPYVRCLSQIFSEGFYYAPDYDLTNSLQRSGGRDPEKSRDEGVLWPDYYNLPYVWNLPACSELFAQYISPRWVTPIVQVNRASRLPLRDSWAWSRPPPQMASRAS